MVLTKIYYTEETQMNMIPVNSSNLSAVGYDKSTMTMHIRFKSGRLYAYYDVPESVYQKLMNAESHGSYFNSMIRGAFADTLIG
jgi:hypothetical protein